MRDPVDQRVDVAVGPLELRDHVRRPSRSAGPPRRAGQVPVDGGQQMQMRVGQRLAEVRDLADLPQQADALRARARVPDLVAPRQEDQAAVVDGVADLEQAVRAAAARSRLASSDWSAREVELAAAPAQRLQRREGVALDRLDLTRSRTTRSHWWRRRCRSAMWRPARPAICAISGGRRRRCSRAVELGAGSANATCATSMLRPMPMASVATRCSTSPAWYMATWALRVRGRQGAQHDGGAALLPAHHLGQRVDLGRREGDDHAAPRQAVQLAVAGVGQDREARPADHLGLGHQPLQDRPDRVRAQEHGLVAATRVQQPVGEDVAALVVGRRAGSRRWRGTPPRAASASPRPCRRDSARPRRRASPRR